MALEQFVRQHGEELLRLAYTYVGNHEVAEDIVQDVLLKAFEQIHQFRGDSTYRTYLYRMTINRSYDYLRSWSYKNTVLTNKFQRIFKAIPSAEYDVMYNEQKNEVGYYIMKLPLKYREMIILYYYKELKIEEIADILECKPNTVKTRLKRAREQLKVILKESEIDEAFANETIY